MTAIQFIVALLIIVAASELFTNAVEWAGFRLHLGAGATGSLLAAFGTSLPETVVPVVALISASHDANSVAIGSVLGAPLLLLTLGVAITGVAVLLRRSRSHIQLSTSQVRRDLGTFVVAFAIVILAGVTHASSAVRIPMGIVLLLIYCLYVVKTLRGSTVKAEMPEPLHIIRWDADMAAGKLSITVQLLIATAMLVLGSELFVHALTNAADSWHINPLILAIVLVPIATELPETTNSVLWIRSGDDGLAFGNVAGSATFQACILGFIGLSFTTWNIGTGVISAIATMITAVYLLLLLWKGKARGGWLTAAALPWISFVLIELVSGGKLAN